MTKIKSLSCLTFGSLFVLIQILEIIRVILKLYEQWKNFDERKEMATILSKMPKPKPPPNRYGTSILQLSYGKIRLQS